MLKAAQIAVLLGRDLDYGPNQRLASHCSEAVRIPGHLCDSLHGYEESACRYCLGHGCRSATGSDRAPADARSSSCDAMSHVVSELHGLEDRLV
jgi:hypothetical protein